MTTSQIKMSEIVGKGYEKFWHSKKRYRVLKGGKGSKKSTTTALNFIYRIMREKESNLLVVRQIFNTHRDSTFAQLKWAQEKLRVSHLWNNTVFPLEMTFKPTGQKILFRGFDDVLKLASTTVSKGYLNYVWIEEAFEIANEYDFDKLDLSVPRGTIPPPLYKQTTLTFNPWSEEHWLKRRFFDQKSNDVDTFSTNYLINEFLDNTDRQVFENMKKSNPKKYSVAGLGNWGISEGLVFENWTVETKVITENEQYKWKNFFGLDYGYTNDPTAFIAFKANPIDKELYIFEEFYEKRLLNSKIAEKIINLGFAKERIRADSAEPKSNDDLRRLGINRIVPSVKGKDSILNGIAAINEYKIYIDPKCRNTAFEFANYTYSERKNAQGLRLPKDSENHLCDALRYAFEDVKYFKPIKDKTINYIGSTISANDINGGWDI